MVAGWFFLTPTDYATLGNHAASSLSFVSNFVYKGEEGYFDTPSQYKWLLHTWSLSVEWQFYLLYPLILFLVRRWNEGRLFFFICLLTVCSFALGVLLSYIKPVSAFYLLPPRIWELSMGGLVRLVPSPFLSQSRRNFVGYLGLLLVACACFMFDTETPWPSFYALFPVVGTALVLWSDSASVSSWIRLPAMQKIGNWSYSIYLWHWPFVAALAYSQMIDASLIFKMVLIALTIAVGACSYAWIEKPSRKWLNGTSDKRALCMTLTAAALLLTVGIAMNFAKGFPIRIQSNKLVMQAEEGAAVGYSPVPANYRDDCGFSRSEKTLKPCPLDSKVNLPTAKFVVWGDSHARSIAESVRDTVTELTGRSGYLVTHQCATIFDSELKSKGANNGCTEFNREALSFVRQLPDDAIVVVANRYSASVHGPNEGISKSFGIDYRSPELAAMEPHAAYLRALPDSLCRIAAVRKTYVLLPIPEMGIDVPRDLARRGMLGMKARDVMLPRAAYDLRNAIAIEAIRRAERMCGITVINPTEVLCDARQCIGSVDGLPVYSDDDHLNAAGRQYLKPVLKRAFEK